MPKLHNQVKTVPVRYGNKYKIVCLESSGCCCPVGMQLKATAHLALNSSSNVYRMCKVMAGWIIGCDTTSHRRISVS